MSNIFIEDIVGQNDFAVPATDAALGTATTELDALLSGVANLSYDRVLAWVETTSGAGASRTLNCVVEKFEYSGEECPDATETQTMTAAIESTLEADADITSIGSQQVHILTAGPYFSWERDAAGGFLYPAITTDDVVVGGDSAPQGKWFQDSDMVLGAAVMSGTEKLRVVGDSRIEGGLLETEFAAVPFAPAAGEGTFWIRDDAPNVPMFTDDAGTDHELAITASVTSLQDVDHVLFVDKTSGAYTPDGSMQAPYNTIGAAITAAVTLNCDTWNNSAFPDAIQGAAPNMTLYDNAGTFRADMVGHYVTITGATTAANNGTFLITAFTDASHIVYRNTNGVAENFTGIWWVPYRVGIVVYPGIYDEALSFSNGFISLIGLDRESTIVKQSSGTTAILYLNKPNLLFKNITFQGDGTHNGFLTQTVVPATGIYDGDVVFENCAFNGLTTGANDYFYPDAYGDHYFYNCVFRRDPDTAMVYYTGSAAGGRAFFHGCEAYGVFRLYHQQEIYAFDSRFETSGTAYGGVVTFNFDGNRRFWNCHFVNTNASGHCVYEGGTMDPAGEFYNCTFEAGANGYAITGNNYGYYVVSGCTMNRGMTAIVRQRTPIRYAGGQAGDKDWYFDLDNAVASLINIPENQDATVYMMADYSGAAWTNPLGVNFTIDGRGRHTLTTNAITPNQGTITYKNMKYVGQLRGGNSSSGSSVILERVYLDGHIDLWRGPQNVGDYLIIHDSVIIGNSSFVRPISMRSYQTYDGKIIISKSYLKGYTGYAPIYFDGCPATSAVQIEYSKLFHGDLGTNSPFSGYNTGTTYAAHHTTFNQEPALADPTNITNDIDSGQRHNTIDPDGDFDCMGDPF